MQEANRANHAREGTSVVYIRCVSGTKAIESRVQVLAGVLARKNRAERVFWEVSSVFDVFEAPHRLHLGSPA